MNDASSGGSGNTNKKSNEKGGSNDEHNKNWNGRRPEKSCYQYSTVNLKGKVEGMFTFGVKDVLDFFWK